MGPTYTWPAHPPSPKISIKSNKYSSLKHSHHLSPSFSPRNSTPATFSSRHNLRTYHSPLISPISLLSAFYRSTYSFYRRTYRNPTGGLAMFYRRANKLFWRGKTRFLAQLSSCKGRFLAYLHHISKYATSGLVLKRK